MNSRKLYEEQLQRPVPDETMPAFEPFGAIRQSNDDNYTPQEDFKSLVIAAARKRRPAD